MSARDPGTWRIGRIGGADLLIRPSLLVVGVLLVLVFEPQFDRVGGGSPYLLAGVFVVSLYLSILVHEVAHLAFARMFAMPVPSITLHMLGGETRIEGEYRSPWQALFTAAAGPFASAIIGVFALSFSHAAASGTTYAVLCFLGRINLLLAIFNLLPGLPLDGGHVLRAIIWAITGRESTGLVAAGWIGLAAALGVVVWSVLNIRGAASDLTGVLLGLFVAWFLWSGARAAIHRGRLMSRVERLVARDLVVTGAAPQDAPRISADLRGRQLLIAMAENPAGSYTLVEPDGAVTGRLDASTVDRAYRGDRGDRKETSS